MSYRWNIGCRDCGDELSFLWDHAEVELAKIASNLCEYEIDCPSGDWDNHAWEWADARVTLADICDFAKKHKGHNVLPISEYGDYLGDDK